MSATEVASELVCPEICWTKGVVTVSVSDAEPTAPLAAVTLKERRVVASDLSSVPEMTPVSLSSVRPVGRAAPFCDQVRSGIPPVAVSTCV